MNSVDQKANAPVSRVYLKLFITVTVLLSITIGAVIWAINSEKFVRLTADYFAGSMVGAAEKVEIEGIKGSIIDGIEIEKLSWRKTTPYQMVTAEKVKLDFDFSQLLAIARVIARVDCSHLEISGRPMPVWVNDLPNFPEVACFANLPGNLLLSEVKIADLVLKPFNEDLLQLRIKELGLAAPDEKNTQKLQASVTGVFRDRKFLEGKLNGTLNQKLKKIEARLEACLAGKKLVTELAGANKKGQVEFSGHLVEAEVDLAIISRWLISMWQDEFPFGFDGLISFSGSWIFNEKTGFIGNLNGDFTRLHMVAQGLFLTIFELNGHWKFFSGNLEVSDSGSFFAGFPAVLSGKVENLLASDRRWNLNFRADHINMGSFYNDLPWGIKYGSGLPQMTGTATFNLQIRGTFPDVAAAFKADEIEVVNQSARHRLTGAINFTFNEKEKMKWQLDLKNSFVEGLPAMFQRFTPATASGPRLEKIMNWSGCSWNGSGKNLGNMQIHGQLQASEQQPVKLQGHFSDSNGRFTATVPEQPLFNSSKLSFLQFLLSY